MAYPITYKGTEIDLDEAHERVLFDVIIDCAKNLKYYEDYNAVLNCAAVLAQRSSGYHQRKQIAEINQMIFDKIGTGKLTY